MNPVANFDLHVGPLLVPFPLLLALAACGMAVLVGKRVGRGAAVDVEPSVWRAVLVAALAARIAFVVKYRSLYAASPLAALDIRDGGWDPLVGLLAAWLYALYVQRRAPALARPLRWAVGAGTVVMALGLAATVLVPSSAPALPRKLALVSLDGEPVPLGRFAGRPVVVNVWATWCPPCVREMPVLRAAQAARPDVAFVFVNAGEDTGHVRRWLQAQGLVLQNVLLDERRQAQAAFDLKGYPTTLFFDREGALVSRRVGELSAATLAQRLRHAAP